MFGFGLGLSFGLDLKKKGNIKIHKGTAAILNNLWFGKCVPHLFQRVV
jgi:hypothetical protein